MMNPLSYRLDDLTDAERRDLKRYIDAILFTLDRRGAEQKLRQLKPGTNLFYLIVALVLARCARGGHSVVAGLPEPL